MKTVGVGKLPPLPPMPRPGKPSAPKGLRASVDRDGVAWRDFAQIERLKARRGLTDNLEAWSNSRGPAEPGEIEHGAVERGRWAVDVNGNTWTKCMACGKVRRAIDVELYAIPFTAGPEMIWRCKEHAIERRGAE